MEIIVCWIDGRYWMMDGGKILDDGWRKDIG